MMDTRSEETLSILTSMKGIVMLAEHYSNPAETREYLTILSSCISRLEMVVKIEKDQRKK
jgi:hypothetical protein